VPDNRNISQFDH